MAEPLDGDLMTRYKDLAKQNDIWLSLGGVHEKVQDLILNPLLNLS